MRGTGPKQSGRKRGNKTKMVIYLGGKVREKEQSNLGYTSFYGTCTANVKFRLAKPGDAGDEYGDRKKDENEEEAKSEKRREGNKQRNTHRKRA